jgi:hypothetical protein
MVAVARRGQIDGRRQMMNWKISFGFVGALIAAGQRSPGQGTWAREGWRTFSQDMIALILFDTPANLPGTPGFNPSLPVSPGFFTGWSIVRHTVKLSADGDHIASAGTNEFHKADDTVYRTGCSTATGQRF